MKADGNYRAEDADKSDKADSAVHLKDDFEGVDNLLNVLELILDQAYVGIIFVDPKGVIRFMNKQYEDLIGVDRKKSYGKHITELFPDSRLPFIINTKKVELGRKYHYKDKGTLIVNRIPIYRGKTFIGAITQCIFRDISEIKEMAKNLDLLKSKVKSYKRTISDLLISKYTFNDIIGISQDIVNLKSLAQKYAKTENTILIGGETGTGKELFAHSIHRSSQRTEGPFVCVNCASIPNDLLESELFGYAPGAFTGAGRNGKVGKIEMANSGTLFLDEIGELPQISQAKLLRVLEEKRVEKVGDLLPVKVDFRLIAATNRKIDFLKDSKKFRQDLYYRLSTMSLMIPPLRKRVKDIPVLIDHFLQKSPDHQMKISDGALDVLMNYTWPGNVRELKNIIQLFLSLAPKGNVIKRIDLPQHIFDLKSIEKSSKGRVDYKLKRRINNNEIQLIKQALRFCKGNKRQAAKLLGISRSSLYNKIKQLSID